MELRKDSRLRYIAGGCFIALALLTLVKFLSRFGVGLPVIHTASFLILIIGYIQIAKGLISPDLHVCGAGSMLCCMFYIFDILYGLLYSLGGHYSAFSVLPSVWNMVSLFIILGPIDNSSEQPKSRTRGIVLAAVNLALFIIVCIVAKTFSILNLLSTVLFSAGVVLIGIELFNARRKW